MVAAGARRSAREATELVARCHAALDATALQVEVIGRLRRVLPFDAVFSSTVDPASLLFTGALAEEIPPEATPRFLANELLEEDVNKFRTLAGQRVPVESLDRVTRARRHASPRYREIMAPLGLGDELRAAFRSGGETWGFICLHREDGPSGFTEADIRLLARLSSHVGEGLRRALLVRAAGEAAAPDAPGVLLLSEGGELVATTAAADQWLWELSDPDPRPASLPTAVASVVATLHAIRAGVGPPDVLPRVRVRTRPGAGPCSTPPRWRARVTPPMSPSSSNGPNRRSSPLWSCTPTA